MQQFFDWLSYFFTHLLPLFWRTIYPVQNLVRWISAQSPWVQVPIVLVVFAALIVLIVLAIEVLPRSGSGYTYLRFAIAMAVPVGIVALLGLNPKVWWLYIVAAALGVGMYLLDRRSQLAGRGAGRILQLMFFCTPGFALLAVGILYPAIRTIIAAFFDKTGKQFVGLNNFVWVFQENSGTGGLTAVVNTMIWVIVAPVFATAIGLLYAVWVDRSRGEKVLKSLVFMPMAISLVGASVIFKFLYDYRQGNQLGLLNQIVIWFGGTPVNWLNEHPLNVALLIAILIWSQTGFAMVILSAAIKGVPEELIEAAQLDGANGLQRFLNVTIPSIRPTIIVVWVTISISALKVYDIVATTTGGHQGTTVLGYEMVKQFQLLPPQSGHSAVLAVILFILVTPFIVYNTRNLRRERSGK